MIGAKWKLNSGFCSLAVFMSFLTLPAAIFFSLRSIKP